MNGYRRENNPDNKEVLTVENLRHLLEIGMPLQHYIEFEISDYIHLGTGLMAGAKIADFQKAE